MSNTNLDIIPEIVNLYIKEDLLKANHQYIYIRPNNFLVWYL